MTIFDFPFPVNHFELRTQSNQRLFTGPYTPTVQTLDLFGERWVVVLEMPPISILNQIAAAAREAFFDRLRGSVNAIRLGHMKRRQPLGTLRGPAPVSWISGGVAAAWISGGVAASWVGGDPLILEDIPQLASTCLIQTLAGRTLLAGDHIGIGGQLVRVMADAVANGAGHLAVEFYPRARQLIPAGSAVLWDYPTANFILKPGTLNVPTSWTPDMIGGATVELIEVF